MLLRVCASLLVLFHLCGAGLAFRSLSDSHPRKISATLNPDCDAPSLCDNETTLVHVRSVGSAQDELHFLWDFTGQPAALALAFDGPANLTINWAAFLDGKPSIKFSRAPSFYFGIVLQSLFVYDDPADHAAFSPSAPPQQLLEYPLRGFTWTRDAFSVSADDLAQVRVHGRDFDASRVASSRLRRERARKSAAAQSVADISITFSTFAVAGHSERIPHLLHTENATEIDLVLRDLRVDEQRNFSCPRVALGVTLLSLDEGGGDGPRGPGNFSLNVRRSLDDEFTPGIFELINFSTRGAAASASEGFLQYRPVSYTDEARDVSTSTAVQQTEPRRPENPRESLAETLFVSVEEIVLERASVAAVNVSFGVSGDGCFGKTNYTTWTFLAAYGEPLPERLSTLVVVVAALGLGIPLLLMISGGCYVCLRRARESS